MYIHDLRIALLIGDLNISGAQKQAIYIARALSSMGAIVQAYYTSDGFRMEILRDAGIDTVCFGRFKPRIARMAHLTALLRAFDPHIVFSTRTYLNLYGGLAAKFLPARMIGTLRSVLEFEHELAGPQLRWMIRLPDLLAVNSYMAQEQVLEIGWASAENVTVLENVIDLDEFDVATRSAVECPRDPAKTLLWIGRIVQQKRPDLLLAVLDLVRQREPDVHIMVVGDGDQRAVTEQRARELGLAQHLTFLGRRSDVSALLAQCAAVLVQTSEYEGFSNVLLEAMAARLPVVAMDAGDTRRIVEEGQTGYVVPVGAVDQMASHILNLLADRERAAQLGAAGRARAEQVYSTDQLPARLIALFEHVLKSELY